MTATVASPGAPARLNVGWTLGAIWLVLRRRAIDLLMIGAVFVVAPISFAALWTDQERAFTEFFASLLGLVFTGAACLITFQELSGGPRIGAVAATWRGLRKFGSLWWVAMIYGLLVLLGGVLLIAPGLIALAGFLPASPAVMVENAKSSAALERAWELTRGSRWRIGGLCALVFLTIVIWLAVCIGIEAGLASALGGPAIAADKFVIAPLSALGMAALMNVFAATAYTGLRLAAEGGHIDAPAAFS
jgi:hypothetical protein